MARKRMFSKDVTESDAFSEMPLTAQALYFHLGMDTDDDGFVGSPRRIQKSIGAADDDMRLLAAKGFVIPFESGAIVVTHHRVNNTLRNNRYKPTAHAEERELLEITESGAYARITPVQKLVLSDGTPSGNQMAANGTPSGSQVSANGMETTLYVNNINSNYNVNVEQEHTLSGKPDFAGKTTEIIGYLNAKLGTRYKPESKSTQRLVKARLKEGFTVDDFKAVIDRKAADWKADPKMSRFLRPETLFGSKFEGYLNERGAADDRYALYR